MTIYMCSICNAPHDSGGPPCAVKVTLDVGRPAADERPSWERSYTCPQCPAHVQPRGGFDVVSFQEHSFAHATAALREAARDARNYRHVLHELHMLFDPPDDGRPDFVGGWPVETTRTSVLFKLSTVLPIDMTRVPRKQNAAATQQKGES